MNEQTDEPQHHQPEHLNEPSAQSTPPSAAFIEKFLHHQESVGGSGRMSSGEFELGLFRIDSDGADEEAAPALEFESQHATDSTSNGDNNEEGENCWRGSLPLYNTSVDVDYAEATVVAPVDLEEGNILRVDMGMRKILVVQVPEGGVKSGETFTAPYQIHHTPLSDLEAFRVKAYNDGHYHGWVTKLFGCCEKDAHSSLGAVCCPCVMLSTVMSRMHLNWCGKRISSVSPSTQQQRQRCTMFCIMLLYTTAFVLTALLILHIVQALYCLEINSLLERDAEEPIMIEAEVEEIEINSDETCDYRINKAYFSSILILDALLWGYILLLMSRARTAIREHHFIYGGPVQDCCVACCCNCCTLTQLERETSFEEVRRLSNVDVSVGDPGQFLNENNRAGQHCYLPIV